MASAYGMVKVVDHDHEDRKLGTLLGRGLNQEVTRADAVALQGGGLSPRELMRKALGKPSVRESRGMGVATPSKVVAKSIAKIRKGHNA